MKNHIYIQKIPLWLRIIGHALWIAGVLSLFIVNTKYGPQFIVVGIFIIFLGLYLITAEGIEIDFKNKSYRTVYRILGADVGFWKDLPPMVYVSVFETRVNQTIGGKTFSSTATATVSSKVAMINLFDADNRPETLYMTKNKEAAVAIAEKLREAYGVEIVVK